MAFSGTLTLGADFVWERVCSHGLPSALESTASCGISTFEAGKLVAESDRSADTAADARGRGERGIGQPVQTA